MDGMIQRMTCNKEHEVAVRDFLMRIEGRGLEMNSIIIRHEGDSLLEWFRDESFRDRAQCVYSVSKSFTSLGIGLLIDENRIALEDKIAPFFQDKLPEKPLHPWVEALTVRHLLTMTTCFNHTTYKRIPGDDWVAGYFVDTPDRRPGESFCYETSASHVLAALVERITGRSLISFLQDRFLSALGVEGAYYETDPSGVSKGGSGLFIRPFDLVKTAELVMHKGKYRGKSLLPARYLEEAVARQVDTAQKGAIREERYGYGYQFWRTGCNSFSFYGMGGQLAVCVPEKDLLLVTTGDVRNTPDQVQALFDAFWETVYEEDCHDL